MGISKEILLISANEIKKINDSQKDLKAGDKLKGQIVKIKPDGKAEIEIDGNLKTEARLDPSFKKGDSLNFTVIRKGNQMVLKLENVIENSQGSLSDINRNNSPNKKFVQMNIDQKLNEFIENEIRDTKNIKNINKQAEQITVEERVQNNLEKVKILSEISTGSESFLRELTDILTNLRSFTSESEFSDKITQSLIELRSIVTNSKINNDPDIKDILLKISGLIEKSNDLKNPDTSQQAKQEILNNMKQEVIELSAVLKNSEFIKGDKNHQNKVEIDNLIDNIIKNIDNISARISDKISNYLKSTIEEVENVQNTLQDNTRSLDLGYQIADKTTSLIIQISNSPVVINNEIVDIIVSLGESTSRIISINSIDKIPQIKESLNVLVSKLPILEQINNEKSVDLPKDLKQNIDLAQEILRSLQLNVNNVLSQLPDDSQMSESIDNLSKSVRNILSGLPGSGELSESMRNDLLKLMSIIKTTDVDPADIGLKTDIAIGSDLIKHKQSSPEDIQELSGDLKKIIRNLQKDLEVLSKDLSKNMIEAEKENRLSQEIKKIHTELSGQKNTLDVTFSMIRKIEELISLIERSGHALPEELKTALSEFNNAKKELEQIISLNDFSKIKNIIKESIEPVHSLMDKFFLSQEVEDNSDLQLKNNNNKNLLNELRADINELLPRLPEHSEHIQNVSQLMKNIEKLLIKISNGSKLSNDAYDLIQAIKYALDRLNSSSSGKLNDLPENIKMMIDKLSDQIKPDRSMNHLYDLIKELRTIRDNTDKAMRTKLDPIISKLIEQSNNELKPSFLKDSQLNLKDRLLLNLDELKSVLPSDDLSDKLNKNHVSVQNLIKQLENSLLSYPDNSEREIMTNTKVVNPNLLHDSFKEFLINNLDGNKSASFINDLKQILEPVLNQSEFMNKFSKAPMDLEQIISRIDMFLKPVEINGKINKLSGLLQNFIKDSGVFFEKNMEEIIEKISESSLEKPDLKEYSGSSQIKTLIKNDIKPNLLLLKEYLDSNRFTGKMTDQKMLDSIKSTIDDLLGNINKQQGRAVDNQPSQSSVQCFSFAVPLDGRNEPLKFTVFYNKKNKENSEDGFMLSLLLSLDRVGEVRSDFFLIKKNLNINIYVKNKKIKGYLAKQIEPLKGTLSRNFENLNIQLLIHKGNVPTGSIDKNIKNIISDSKVDVKI